MVQAPVLETKRLILRGHTAADFEAVAAMWADPLVVKYLGVAGKPLPRQEAWARILRYVGHWQVMKYGSWAVIDKVTAKLVGDLGYHNLKRDIQPSFDGIPELGWVLASEFHGKGLATEALSEIIAWGDRNIAGPRTVCIIDPQNTASLRVAKKLGFNETHRTEYQGHETAVFERWRR